MYSINKIKREAFSLGIPKNRQIVGHKAIVRAEEHPNQFAIMKRIIRAKTKFRCAFIFDKVMKKSSFSHYYRFF